MPRPSEFSTHAYPEPLEVSRRWPSTEHDLRELVLEDEPILEGLPSVRCQLDLDLHSDHMHIDVSTMGGSYQRYVATARSTGEGGGSEEPEGYVDPSEIPDVTDEDRARWDQALNTSPYSLDESGGGVTVDELLPEIDKALGEWNKMKEEQ